MAILDRLRNRTIISPVVAEPEYLPLQEAVRVYSTSRDTLYRLLAAGKLHRYRRQLDRRVWLRRAELEVVFKVRRAPGRP